MSPELLTLLLNAATETLYMVTVAALLGTLFGLPLPGILLGLTLTIVSLLGNSAMVGAVGGGGLGIRFGYQRFMPEVMTAVVIVLIVLVQRRTLGERVARRPNKRARAS